MRSLMVPAAAVLLLNSAAFAQTTPPPSTPPALTGGATSDQERACNNIANPTDRAGCLGNLQPRRDPLQSGATTNPSVFAPSTPGATTGSIGTGGVNSSIGTGGVNSGSRALGGSTTAPGGSLSGTNTAPIGSATSPSGGTAGSGIGGTGASGGHPAAPRAAHPVALEPAAAAVSDRVRRDGRTGDPAIFYRPPPYCPRSGSEGLETSCKVSAASP
jgi:hypothetical protein